MDQEIIMPLVIKDLATRFHVGLRKYGEPLHTFNGRNALQDAYEEVLDLAMYLRQAIAEQDDKPNNEVSNCPPHNHSKIEHPEKIDGMPKCPACEWFYKKAEFLNTKIAQAREESNLAPTIHDNYTGP